MRKRKSAGEVLMAEMTKMIIAGIVAIAFGLFVWKFVPNVLGGIIQKATQPK